jgi:predicted GNAT family acetyltransferase
VTEEQAGLAFSDNAEMLRYEVHIDGRLAGHSRYELRDGLITFRHTEVDPAYEGRGIAGRLVAYELDDARSRGLRVAATCTFVRAYVDSHPEYADLVEERA